jgi:tetraacyldisaccharide 4'-kinase
MGISAMRSWITRLWQTSSIWVYLLLPLAWLYRAVVAMRRCCYQHGLAKIYTPPVPVIIIGNISVGGTGKTPLVIAIACFLTQRGYKVGIVSRGYGGKAEAYPFWVKSTSSPQDAGDEPLLIARKTHCPVVVDPKRARGVQTLIQQHACDMVLADDGLQHYALARSIEIAVIDGVRRMGNGYCLPAGPLREPQKRLHGVDIIVSNGKAQVGEFAMQLKTEGMYSLVYPQHITPLSTWHGQRVHAVAGIGNPPRFFQLLRNHGLVLIEHEFADHHAYRACDLDFADDLPIVMTEKDAVKCAAFATKRHWYLAVAAELPSDFWWVFTAKLAQVKSNA